MVNEPTDHGKRNPLETRADEVGNAILTIILENLTQNIIDEASHPGILLHLLADRKDILGKNFSKSGHIEIISPVPRTVENQNMTKISGKVDHQFLSPVVRLDFVKKSRILKRFKSRKGKKGE
jgi:hypothetical protein